MRTVRSLGCAIGLSITLTAAFAEAPVPTAADVTAAAQEALDRNYPANGPGAALLIARGDEVLFRGARGRGSIELDVPLTADHVFRIGSVTKQFAAVALLKLVDEGKLVLEDPLSKFIPDYPHGQEITVEQILNHTSGVASYTSIPGYMAGTPARADLTTMQLVDIFKDLPLDFQPGTSFLYNNSGYVLVAAVIEVVSGTVWNEQLRSALFEPLGLKHTAYGADNLLIPNMVRGYTFTGPPGNMGAPIPAPFMSMTQPNAAGALVSTVDDLLRWNRKLHEGDVLNAQTYQRLITAVGAAKGGAFGFDYGFGIGSDTVRGRKALLHAGGMAGASAVLMYMPEQRISVVLLQNTDRPPSGLSPQVISRRLAAVTLGDPFPEMHALPFDAQSATKLEGTYTSATKKLPPAQVRVINGKLTVQLYGPMPMPLQQTQKDRFVLENGLTELHFKRDGRGNGNSLVFFREGEGAGDLMSRTGDAPSIQPPQPPGRGQNP